MDIEIAKKIVKGIQISEKELNQFITGYVKLKLDIDVTKEQLFGINTLVKGRVFNLYYAAETALRILEVPFTKVFNKQGEPIKIIL